MIEVSKYITADNVDVLAGSQLDQISDDGVFEILVASSTATDTITVMLGDAVLVNNQIIAMRTNGVPSMSEDVPISIETEGGVRPIISIDIATAANVMCRVFFTPYDELED